MVAYECLAGQRPFPGTNPIAVASAHVREQPPPLPDDVPGPVRDLVLRAMEKDPAMRPAHAGDLGRAAFALAAGPPDEASPRPRRAEPEAPAPQPAALPRPRSSTGGAVRIASVLLLVVVIGLSARACLAPSSVVVPHVAAGSTVDAATQELAARHLDAVRTTETSKTVAAGRVIRTEPAAGTTAKEGDRHHPGWCRRAGRRYGVVNGGLGNPARPQCAHDSGSRTRADLRLRRQRNPRRYRQRRDPDRLGDVRSRRHRARRTRAVTDAAQARQGPAG